MALPPTTANWHWKNKNVTQWGKEWFERELTTLVVTGDAPAAEGESEETVRVSTVFDVEGDIELGQRKSKLITIYDCKLIVDWEGIARDGTEVKGRVHIPEVSHEITLDGLSEYVFMWEITSTPKSSPSIDSVLALAKTKLKQALETKFAQFPVDLIDTHGRDLTVSATPSQDPSRSGTPAPAPAALAGSFASTAALKEKPAIPEKAAPKKALNIATVTVEASFMATAADLFELLTDEKKIPGWTRAAAVSQALPNTPYSLFAGGVKGTYISLTKPTEIVQSWALVSPTWPDGHEGTLRTTIDQQSDSTKVTFSLQGVPTGLQDEIKRNLEGYYIHGFKSIGYVPFFVAPSSPSFIIDDSDDDSPKSTKAKRRAQAGSDHWTEKRSSYLAIVFITILIVLAAVVVPFFSSSLPPIRTRRPQERTKTNSGKGP